MKMPADEGTKCAKKPSYIKLGEIVPENEKATPEQIFSADQWSRRKFSVFLGKKIERERF
jgi:hypothetical protein